MYVQCVVERQEQNKIVLRVNIIIREEKVIKINTLASLLKCVIAACSSTEITTRSWNEALFNAKKEYSYNFLKELVFDWGGAYPKSKEATHMLYIFNTFKNDIIKEYKDCYKKLDGKDKEMVEKMIALIKGE